MLYRPCTLEEFIGTHNDYASRMIQLSLTIFGLVVGGAFLFQSLASLGERLMQAQEALTLNTKVGTAWMLAIVALTNLPAACSVVSANPVA